MPGPLELIILACLTASPEQCREHRIPISGSDHPLFCLRVAPGQIAKWGGEHPKWTLREWRCAPVSFDEHA